MCLRFIDKQYISFINKYGGAAMSRFLPGFFRVAFAVLAIFATVMTVLIVVVMLVDPELPPGAHFGPGHGNVLGQPASFGLGPIAEGQAESALYLRAFNDNVSLTINQPAGAVELLKAHGLPVLLMYGIFFAALFELLRRLFRNVGSGQSFTTQSVRLVQIVGGSLIVFSLVTAIAESWFAYAMYGYLAQHAQVAISGTPVQLPPAQRPPLLGNGFPLHRPALFAGLLVLALAEVFRQGLALQRDNDLTV
jgi:hypothetical protein